MRMLTVLAMLLAPAAAHAGAPASGSSLALRVDAGLVAAAQRLLAENQAFAVAPALEEAGGMAARHGAPHHDSGVLSGVGVGLQVGTPTAVTFKFHSGANTDIVLGVGAFFNDAGGYALLGGLSLHGDYLFTLATLVNNGTIDLTAYLGPGLWLNLFNSGIHYGYFGGYYYAGNVGLIGIAGRLPLGLDMRFGGAPIEVYLELDPALFVFPGVDLFVGASLGFRWFF